MSTLAAVAAVSSGLVKSAAGYHWLANFATVAAVLILTSAFYVYRSSVEPAQATA